jgi:hypothetical protein
MIRRDAHVLKPVDAARVSAYRLESVSAGMARVQTGRRRPLTPGCDSKSKRTRRRGRRSRHRLRMSLLRQAAVCAIFSMPTAGTRRLLAQRRLACFRLIGEAQWSRGFQDDPERFSVRRARCVQLPAL